MKHYRFGGGWGRICELNIIIEDDFTQQRAGCYYFQTQ